MIKGVLMVLLALGIFVLFIVASIAAFFAYGFPGLFMSALMTVGITYFVVGRIDEPGP